MARLSGEAARMALAGIEEAAGGVPRDGKLPPLTPPAPGEDPFERAMRVVEAGERLIAEAEAQGAKLGAMLEGFEPEAVEAFLGRDDKLEGEAQRTLKGAVEGFREDAMREAEEAARAAKRDLSGKPAARPRAGRIPV